MFDDFIRLVREIYQTDEFIPLHEPKFLGNEKKYLLDVIDSTYVSSVGAYVDQFEAEIADYTGSKYAIATVNGTAALHVALLLAGVEQGTEVITQSLTFVATCNAIKYCGAEPVFVDIERDNLGLSPDCLCTYLKQSVELRNGVAWNKVTERRISACLAMHTFGVPANMDKLLEVCNDYNIPLVEDAAESLGSTLNGQHAGTFGLVAALSFNGNKVITSGGGGMILTNDAELAKRAKHLTTTAKLQHSWEFVHDELGFNYRMPNINAALGLAQLEMLPKILSGKRQVAERYYQWCKQRQVDMLRDGKGVESNGWLSAFVLQNKTERDTFLEKTNEAGIMTRPIWKPMHQLEMFKNCVQGDLSHTEWAADRVVNIPSSAVNL